MGGRKRGRQGGRGKILWRESEGDGVWVRGERGKKGEETVSWTEGGGGIPWDNHGPMTFAIYYTFFYRNVASLSI